MINNNVYFLNNVGNYLLESQKWCYRQIRWIRKPPQGSITSIITNIIAKILMLVADFMERLGTPLKNYGVKKFVFSESGFSSPILRELFEPVHQGEPLQSYSPPSSEPNLILNLPKDILIYTFTFVETKDLINLSVVSKQFRQAAQADQLWQRGLEIYQLWGASREWTLTRVARNFVWQDQSAVPFCPRTIDQVRTYLTLQQQSSFEDLIIRQIPGGPCAYDKLPVVTLDTNGKTTLQSVTAPIMKAIHKGNHCIVMRFKDNRDNTHGEQCYIEVIDLKEWKSFGHGYFSEGQLRNRDDQYLIRLLRGEPCGQHKWGAPLSDTQEAIVELA